MNADVSTMSPVSLIRCVAIVALGALAPFILVKGACRKCAKVLEVSYLIHRSL